MFFAQSTTTGHIRAKVKYKLHDIIDLVKHIIYIIYIYYIYRERERETELKFKEYMQHFDLLSDHLFTITTLNNICDAIRCYSCLHCTYII